MAMNRNILIIFLTAQFQIGVVLNGQTTTIDDSPPIHTPGTLGSAAEKTIKKLYADDQKRRIEGLPITYMVNSTDSKLRPAYVRYRMGFSGERVYYVWKGVSLNRKDIPVVDGAFHGLDVTDVTQFPKARIYPVNPPCFYYKAPGKDKYFVGYLDTSALIFYQWKGVELNKNQIPDRAKSSHIIFKLSPHKQWDGGPAIESIVLISPPPSRL